MKRIASLLAALIVIVGVLYFVRADVNHGHGPGYHAEDSHEEHGDPEHEADGHDDQRGEDTDHEGVDDQLDSPQESTTGH